jgi:hypothetical protein
MRQGFLIEHPFQRSYARFPAQGGCDAHIARTTLEASPTEGRSLFAQEFDPGNPRLDARPLPTCRLLCPGDALQHRTGGSGGRSAIAPRMCWNRPRDIITSAIWKVTERPWRMILAPIFTSRSRSGLSDHCLNGEFGRGLLENSMSSGKFGMRPGTHLSHF